MRNSSSLDWLRFMHTPNDYRVSHNHFVEQEKEVLFPLTIFIRKVLLATCTGISFIDSTSLRYVVTKES